MPEGNCLHIDKQEPAVSSVDAPSLVFVFDRKVQSNINCVLVVNTLGSPQAGGGLLRTRQSSCERQGLL